MMLETWTGSAQYADDLANVGSFPAADSIGSTDGTAFVELNDTSDEFVVQMTGYFSPPNDGDYVFVIMGSDSGQLSFDEGTTAAVVCIVGPLVRLVTSLC